MHLQLFRDKSSTWVVRDLSPNVFALFGTSDIPTPFFGSMTFEQVKAKLLEHPANKGATITEIKR